MRLLLCLCAFACTVQALHINLYVNYYVDKVPERQVELDKALALNVANPLINKIYLLVENVNPPPAEKIQLIPIVGRPTFRTVFDLMTQFNGPNEIGITTNSDIYFDTSLDKVRAFYKKPSSASVAMALTRYNVLANGSLEKMGHPNWTQDTWIILGKPKPMGDLNFIYGRPQCDNRIAYELLAAGYRVINPYYSVTTYHLHLSGIRHYGVEWWKESTPKPYHYVDPVALPV
ncbi:Hypothetical protein POVN_LOCUS190 [uncultured virus]|nr:Hypothetical protein POVN_LOCUS190 [uncultured virus]